MKGGGGSKGAAVHWRTCTRWLWVSANNNNVAGGIERDANRMLELTCSRSLAADGADVRAVTVAKNLQSMVAAVGNNKVALAVKRDAAAIAECKLSVA